MNLSQRIQQALREHVKTDTVYVEDDDGVWGLVIASCFRGVSSLERAKTINRVLRSDPVHLSQAELKRVMLIVPLTPAEFEFAASEGGALNRWMGPLTRRALQEFDSRNR